MRVLQRIKFDYVQSAPIDVIKAGAKDKSWWDWTKAELKIGKIIMSDGYRDAKKDISFFYKNFNKELSPEQRRRMYEIKSNLWKVPPIAILFWFPGGLPIVLFYMAFLPALTPTWFLLDKYKLRLDTIKRDNQKAALRYFIDCGSIKFEQNEKKGRPVTTLNSEVFKNMSYEQQRKLMELCYGQSYDGTNIIRKTIKLNFNALVSKAFSSFLMVRNMEERLKGEFSSTQTENQDILTQKVLKQVHLLTKEKHFC